MQPKIHSYHRALRSPPCEDVCSLIPGRSFVAFDPFNLRGYPITNETAHMAGNVELALCNSLPMIDSYPAETPRMHPSRVKL
jgi:hypothetical protein